MFNESEFTQCACERCQEICTRNPGWFIPSEARKAIEAGYADRLMRDWLDPCEQVGNEERIYLLAPASEGFAGCDAPELDEMAGGYGMLGLLAFFSPNPPCKGPCVLQDDQGLCTIHDSGFKPLQCRSALGCNENRERSTHASNYDIAKIWDSDEGREVLDLWHNTLRENSEGPQGHPVAAT